MDLTRIREGGDEPALTIDGRTLTYAQLRAAAAAVAAGLDGARRVAVWAEPRLETCIATAAALESGVELVPLNPKLGSAELEHIVCDSRPEAVLAAADEASAAGPVAAARAAGVGVLAVDPDARGGELPVHGDRGPEATALVLYTSGTTGRPKGALLPRRAIAANLDALAEAWAWTADDRLVHGLPLFHAHGLVLGVVGTLRRGGHFHHLGRFTPEGAARVLAEGGTMLFAVPTMYHRLAAEAERDPAVARGLAGARLLVSGSAGLPAVTFARIERTTGQRIVERYGLTETLMNTAVRADGERRPGEVGPPLPNVEVRVVTEDGGEAPADGETMGEVAVRGPNVFTGYLNRPDATAAALRDGWFWTGDLATRAPDGYLRIVGRRSTDLIKTGGFKVGAGEVEGALLEHPAVSEAAVRGVPDDDLGERIVAWVVLEPAAAPPSVDALADHVAGLLAPHKRPREVRFVDALPRNALGKVVKQRLTV
jgi:malonyl-CoA/methylmalonyl-CoA synthetase